MSLMTQNLTSTSQQIFFDYHHHAVMNRPLCYLVLNRNWSGYALQRKNECQNSPEMARRVCRSLVIVV